MNIERLVPEACRTRDGLAGALRAARRGQRLAPRARHASLALGLTLLGLGLHAQTQAQPRSWNPAEIGRREYLSNCAACHGMDARGDGPMRPYLVRPASDLTTLTMRNGGTFPKSAIGDLIDGRGQDGEGPHGTRDMPIWGQVYREESETALGGAPFPAEWSVRGRIMALVEYLLSIQRH